MQDNLENILQNVSFSNNGIDYIFVNLELPMFDSMKILVENTLEPKFIFKEGDFTTLIVKVEELGFYREVFSNLEATYICNEIVCTINTSLEVVGLTKEISKKLAEYDISANVVAAFFHDHIFVPKEKGNLALKVLNDLKK